MERIQSALTSSRAWGTGAPIVLTVSEENAVSGRIFLWLLPVGKVEGILSATGDLLGRVSTPLFFVGSVSGHLEKDSGGGSYTSVAGNGIWSAQKN